MIINNDISLCYDDTGHPLDLSNVRTIVVHRISMAAAGIEDSLLTGQALCEKFLDKSLGTGGRPPYHLLNKPDGNVDQMLPLSIRGAHAIEANPTSWAIANVGNFTRDTIPDIQFDTLAKLCALLTPFNGGLRIMGHDQVPGGSNDEHKECPGHLLDIDKLIDRVLQRLPGDWKAWAKNHQEFVITESGMVL